MLMKSRHNRDVDEINRDYIVRRLDKIFTKDKLHMQIY